MVPYKTPNVFAVYSLAAFLSAWSCGCPIAGGVQDQVEQGPGHCELVGGNPMAGCLELDSL